MLTAVKEFGRTITPHAGAPSGTIEAYVEVAFQLGDRVVQPDGLIRVTRGKRVWTTLVEVKTGTNELQRDQLEAYLDVAKQEVFAPRMRKPELVDSPAEELVSTALSSQDGAEDPAPA